jgi:hypothetical protein
VTTNPIHSPGLSELTLVNQKANTLIAENSTLTTSVFCLPALSARNPIPILLTVLTAFSVANKAAPNAAEYPNLVVNSGMNVIGTKFPPACVIAPIALKMNVGFFANCQFTNVGRRLTTLGGGVAKATSNPMTRSSIPTIRSVHAAPNFANIALVAVA